MTPRLGAERTHCRPSAATPTGLGYWLLGSDGRRLQLRGRRLLRQHGRAATEPTGRRHRIDACTGFGYWHRRRRMAASSASALPASTDLGRNCPLNAPVIGIAPSVTGNGYTLVAEDAGTFDYGDPPHYGSAGPAAPALGLRDIIGMARSPENFYWIARSGGSSYGLGHANSGMMWGEYPAPACNPVVAIFSNPQAQGWRLVTRDCRRRARRCSTRRFSADRVSRDVRAAAPPKEPASVRPGLAASVFLVKRSISRRRRRAGGRCTTGGGVIPRRSCRCTRSTTPSNKKRNPNSKSMSDTMVPKPGNGTPKNSARITMPPSAMNESADSVAPIRRDQLERRVGAAEDAPDGETRGREGTELRRAARALRRARTRRRSRGSRAIPTWRAPCGCVPGDR